MTYTIKVKYLGATNTKGDRLKLTWGGATFTEPRDYSINACDQARAMAMRVITEFYARHIEMGKAINLLGGSLDTSTYVFLYSLTEPEGV